MRPDMLFHPYHVIPTVELIPALVKLPNHPVAKVRMETYAVFTQMLVLCFRIGDAGV